MRYTIRKVPPALDAALRRRAKAEQKSLNQTLLEALARQRDLSAIARTWKNDKAIDDALADQQRIDPGRLPQLTRA